MDDDSHRAMDVPGVAAVSVSPSSSPTTATVDVYVRRSCPRCGRRMSALKFDKHTYPISTLPEHLHSISLSYAVTT